MDNDVDVDKPNNLLFANIDGEDQLVGVAYLFMDKVNTTKEIPFESELAAWHDHPQFAGPGQTLHMLHVWFIESSNGPFAGLNFGSPSKPLEWTSQTLVGWQMKRSPIRSDVFPWRSRNSQGRSDIFFHVNRQHLRAKKEQILNTERAK